jgi:hypothetical protein
LGETLKEEQAKLRRTAADITEKKEQSQGPAEKAALEIGLATVEIRRTTADFREQLNDLGKQTLVQARRNALARQTVDRLRALVEKYEAGDVPAQGVFIFFDRLVHERAQASESPVKALREELQQLNARLFALDDRLYDFDSRADEVLSRLRVELKTEAGKDIEVAVSAVRKPLEEQKAALREQQGPGKV